MYQGVTDCLLADSLKNGNEMGCLNERANFTAASNINLGTKSAPPCFGFRGRVGLLLITQLQVVPTLALIIDYNCTEA